jgi:hypothetical protein
MVRFVFFDDVMQQPKNTILLCDILLLSYLSHTFIPLFLGENANKVPSSASNMMTQILWAGTKYVGCADATTNDSWQDAVLSGKACSSTCPSDGTC